VHARIGSFVAAMATVAVISTAASSAPVQRSTYLDGPEPYPGFSSPYIGHEGFRNLPLDFSDQDEALLDVQRDLGLRWTFSAVVWAGMEPNGPTDAQHDPTGAWAKVDRWVEACRERGINLLLQPVMRGNGVAPPAWAGYRTPIGYRQAQSWTDPDGGHHSVGAGTFPGPPRAPMKMQAAADFMGKLVRRYKPGGELAQEQGWTDGYGVRAWEIDNEPDAYGVWTAELDDYAELVTRAHTAIKREDPAAIVLGPAGASGAIDGEMPPLMMMLDRRMQRASLEYKRNGRKYVLGPNVDAVSFHNYEDLDDSTAEEIYRGYRAWWDLYATQTGFAYDPSVEFWMTEGGQLTLDDDWAPRWFPQYFARGFGAGISRMIVQGLTDEGLADTRVSVATFIELFPDPAGMAMIAAAGGPAQIYRDGDARWTYVAWASQGTVTVSIPVRTATARIVDIRGTEQTVAASGGAVQVTLRHADQFNEPVYVVEA
jgi:hypothetical protein